MFIPKEVIIFILGYITCPVTAYLWLKYKEHKEKKNGDNN